MYVMHVSDTYIHAYIHTYMHACIHTYIACIHYITLHYNTSHYITLHYITYIHTYTHTYIHTYIHTHILITPPATCRRPQFAMCSFCVLHYIVIGVLYFLSLLGCRIAYRRRRRRRCHRRRTVGPRVSIRCTACGTFFVVAAYLIACSFYECPDVDVPVSAWCDFVVAAP